MIIRVLVIVALGALAYLLEYSGFPFEALTKTIIYVLSFVLIILLASKEYFGEHAGRLPATAERDESTRQSLFRSDPVFGLGATIYAGVYLIVLRYSDTGGPYRLIEWLMQFTPTDWFWLVAPIYVLWLLRTHSRTTLS